MLTIRVSSSGNPPSKQEIKKAASFSQLKQELANATGIPPERQRVFNMGPPRKELRLSDESPIEGTYRVV